MLLFSNNAETTTGELLEGSHDAVGIVAVDNGTADSFSAPQQWSGARRSQLATLTHPDNQDEFEVVEINARSGNIFEVKRAVEGGLREWPVGTKMSARITAKTLGSFPQLEDTAAFQKAVSIDSPSFVLNIPSSSEGATLDVDCSGSNSIVLAGRSALSHAVQISRYPVLQIENARTGNGYQSDFQDANLSYPSVGGTFPVDLGAPLPWEPGKTYYRGSVVVPAFGNGLQFWMEAPALGREFTTGAIEPAFAAGVTEEENSEPGARPALWRSTAMPIDFEQSLRYPCVVTEVGFIASVFSATAPPSISIGTDVNPTRYANNVPLAQITASGSIHRIPVAEGGVLASALRYKVNTPAAGGQCLGRFYFRGFFVETMDV